MKDEAALAMQVARFTAGWRPQGAATKDDLAEARLALERTLRSGMSAVVADLPKSAAVAAAPPAAGDGVSIAQDLAAARPLALLRALPVAEGLARSVPPWAHGVARVGTLGPFADSLGAPHWIDLIPLRNTFSIVRGPSNTPLAELQLELPTFAPPAAPPIAAGGVAPAMPTVQAQIGSGSLWLVARAFDPAAPINAFAGLAFAKGHVTITGPYTVTGGVVTLGPATTLLLELTPVAAPPPTAGTGGGADFRDMTLVLPPSIGFRFAPTGNSLSAMADASLSVYGNVQAFTHRTATPQYNAPLALLAFPCTVAPATFAVSGSASPIFALGGRAAVLEGAYALPVVTTSTGALGAAASGGYLSLVTAGALSVALAAASSPAPAITQLAGAVLLATPGSLLVFVQNTVPAVQRFDLWDGHQARPSSLQASVAVHSTIVFVATQSSEYTLEDAVLSALLDRPVDANGSPVPVGFPSALVAVLLVQSPAELVVFATQAASNTQCSIVLENAWLRLGLPTGIEAFGRLQGNRLVHGALGLTMPFVRMLPTLPDPYLAVYGAGRDAGIPGGAANVFASVLWTMPTKPELLFAWLPVPTGAAPAAATAVVRAETLLAAERGRMPALAELLDVSTHADLLGVFLFENTGALGFAGQSLVGQLDQLLLVAVPQISWEPLLVPDQNWNFISPDDGTPLAVFVQSTQRVRVAPAALFDLDGTSAAVDRTLGLFTLPFGIEATLDTGASGPSPPGFKVVRPHFPQQRGARQLAIRSGNLPAPNAALPGSAAATMPYGLTVLNSPKPPNDPGSAGTMFNGQFQSGAYARIPVGRYDLCGYGASMFSNWLPGSGDPSVGVANARFDVSVGRTIYEVVQVKSYIYPWAIPVVETVTLQRLLDGSVIRIATGWQAYAPGVFNFGADPSNNPNVPAAQIQSGPFAGLFNVRNITSTAQTQTVSSGIAYQQVYFDADVQLVDRMAQADGVKLVSGQDANRRFQSRGVLGWLQTTVGNLSTITDLAELMTQTGPASGPIAGIIDVGGNRTLMSLALVEADLSPNAAAGSSIVGAVRGAPQLPRDGAWSVSKRTGTSPPVSLGSDAPVPLVRPNGTAVWQMAEPAEVGAAVAQTFYGLLQSTGTQKSLYETPNVAPNGSGYTFPQVPNLADVGALLGLSTVFPDLGSALKPPSLSGLDVSGDGLATKIEWNITDASLIHPGRKLLDFGPVQVYLEFTTDPTVSPPPKGSLVTLTLDPMAGASANGRWSFSITGLNAYVVVSGFSDVSDPLLWISGDASVSEKSAPGFSHLDVHFGSAMDLVNKILTKLSQIASELPGGTGAHLSVKFAGSALSISEGFALPTLPLGFGEISNVAMNLGSSIDLLQKQLTFQVGIGSPSAPVTWSFFPLAGNGCVVVAADQKGLAVTIQAGLGIGLTIDVAVASGSASIVFALQVDVSSAQFELKAMLIGNAQVDVLGGLASASLTLSADLDIENQPLGSNTFDVSAQVAVSIHITVCWVASVDFDGSWSMSEELTA